MKKIFEKSLYDLEEETFPHYQWFFLVDLILILVNLNGEMHLPFNEISNLFSESIKKPLVTCADFIFVNLIVIISPIVLFPVLLILFRLAITKQESFDNIIKNIFIRWLDLLILGGQRIFIYLFTILLIFQGDTFVKNFFGYKHYSTNKIENYWFGMKYNLNRYSFIILLLLFFINIILLLITIVKYFEGDTEIKTINTQDKNFKFTEIKKKELNKRMYYLGLAILN